MWRSCGHDERRADFFAYPTAGPRHDLVTALARDLDGSRPQARQSIWFGSAELIEAATIGVVRRPAWHGLHELVTGYDIKQLLGDAQETRRFGQAAEHAVSGRQFSTPWSHRDRPYRCRQTPV
jgi:hypothetical protein